VEKTMALPPKKKIIILISSTFESSDYMDKKEKQDKQRWTIQWRT